MKNIAGKSLMTMKECVEFIGLSRSTIAKNIALTCERCPSFWDDEGDADETEMGCNVHPKKMAYLLNQENKRIEAMTKRDFKENKLVKHYSILPKEERGYKAYRNNGTWMGFWTDDYRPNMKGGHHHNHIKNKMQRTMFSKKELKQIRRLLKRSK